ncbi:MAG: serine/threonine-protein kinase [Myxococcota bacterium]|nr:serine/threonine-protein kinase [Myxococcota bacterium]
MPSPEPSPPPRCPHCGADPADDGHRGDPELCPNTFQPMDAPGLLGTTVDRYRLVRWLGGGGFGAVYEAEHQVVGRRVALKILHRDRRHTRTSIERFFGEARAAAAIGSPHIVEVYDGGTEGDVCFLAIELIDGCSLHDLLQARRRLPVRRAARIIDQVLEALEAAHAAGIVHRDIKPANIMLEGTSADGSRSRDFVRLVDFGISKIPRGEQAPLTRTGAGMGTPGYGSPEQFLSAGTADERADVYAASAVLFHMLTGELPHEDACSYEEFVVRVCTRPARPLTTLRPDLTDALGAALAEGLAIDPAARIESAAAMRQGLAVVLDGFEEDPEALPVAPTPPRVATPSFVDAPTRAASEPPIVTPPEVGRRSRAGIALGLGLAAAVSLGAGGWLALEWKRDAAAPTAPSPPPAASPSAPGPEPSPEAPAAVAADVAADETVDDTVDAVDEADAPTEAPPRRRRAARRPRPRSGASAPAPTGEEEDWRPAREPEVLVPFDP